MFRVLTDGCKPTRGTKFSACIDLYASEDKIIDQGSTGIVGLGVSIDNEFIHSLVDEHCGHPYDLRGAAFSVDESYNKHCHDTHTKNFEWFMSTHYLQLEPRSSLRAKGLQAGTGIIDLDYPDEIKLIVHNPVRSECLVENFDNTMAQIELDDGRYEIKKGDRIAQIMLNTHKTGTMKIETKEERVGGLGSTDK